jgi:hypothetical protein
MFPLFLAREPTTRTLAQFVPAKNSARAEAGVIELE